MTDIDTILALQSQARQIINDAFDELNLKLIATIDGGANGNSIEKAAVLVTYLNALDREAQSMQKVLEFEAMLMDPDDTAGILAEAAGAGIFPS